MLYNGEVDSFFFSSRRRHTRYWRDWSSDVCSSDLVVLAQEKLRDALGKRELARASSAVDEKGVRKALEPRCERVEKRLVPGMHQKASEIGRASCRERV